MKLKKHENEKECFYQFKCPGCNMYHVFWTKGNLEWKFNGDMDKPTFTPSLLNSHNGNPPYRCHLFLTNGIVEFCGDCTHDSKNKKLPLQDIPE